VSELLDVRREGAIARVVMHRKGNNAIAEDLMSELAAAFDNMGKDPEVRAIVLESGYEKYFSVGADLTSMMVIDRESPDAAAQIAVLMQRMNDHFAAIERCPKPVIAAINGHALGGGSELTLCCDFRIMVEDGRSRIGQTESSLGIIPGAGGTQRLPRLIGAAHALRMLLAGDAVEANEAIRLGLVTYIAPGPRELVRAAGEIARSVTARGPVAARLAKEAVHKGCDLTLDQGIRLEEDLYALLQTTADRAEGIRAFLEKRKPLFRGA